MLEDEELISMRGGMDLGLSSAVELPADNAKGFRGQGRVAVGSLEDFRDDPILDVRKRLARMKQCLCIEHSSEVLFRVIMEGDVEDGDVRMLELEALFSHRKRPVSNSKELLFIQQQISFVIDGPFVFARHAEGIHRTGIDAQPTEETTGHVHVILPRIPLGRLARDFCTDDSDHARGTGRFTEVTANALFGPIVISQQRQHAAVIIGQDTLFVGILERDGSIMEKVTQGRFHPYKDLIERNRLEPLLKLAHEAWLLTQGFCSMPDRYLTVSSPTQSRRHLRQDPRLQLFLPSPTLLVPLSPR